MSQPQLLVNVIAETREDLIDGLEEVVRSLRAGNIVGEDRSRLSAYDFETFNLGPG